MSEKEIIEKFQSAARHVMERMERDDGFARKMYATESYSQIINAYAASKGKELPPRASMMDVTEVWNLIHAE